MLQLYYNRDYEQKNELNDQKHHAQKKIIDDKKVKTNIEKQIS